MKNLICNDELLHHIRANLNRFVRRTHEKDGYRRAAVAITIVDIQHDPGIYDIPFYDTWNEHAAIVLTRRSSQLKRHANQWALPGGKIDAGESPEKTALRELEEEVGLKLDPDLIIGRLDDYSTRSGFTIKPVVVWGGPDTTLTANPG